MVVDVCLTWLLFLIVVIGPLALAVGLTYRYQPCDREETRAKTVFSMITLWCLRPRLTPTASMCCRCCVYYPGGQDLFSALPMLFACAWLGLSVHLLSRYGGAARFYAIAPNTALTAPQPFETSPSSNNLLC